jgi:hypothetical protein
MLVAAALVVIWLRQPVSRDQGLAAAGTNSQPANSNSTAAVTPSVAAQKTPGKTTARQSAADLARQRALFASFQTHPFAAVKTNSAFGWTAEDGKNPDVIHQLAHNELEFERLAAESDRVYRRQLVYHNDTVAAQIERAKLTGEPLREMQLPGLDGAVISFQIAAADVSRSGRQGAFSGRVAGRPDSVATFSFKGGREAFTIISPADNLYLFGEPREPGEIIVKSVDISKYPVGAGDDVMPAGHK